MRTRDRDGETEMIEVRWVTFFVMLQLTAAVTGQSTTFFITRAGDDVTLPCNNLLKNQDKCDQTSWLYSQFESRVTGELITLGQIGRRAKAKSSRLSVTADCSLVIKNVTREDVGRYICRQFNKEGKQEGEDARVILSVTTFNELQNKDMTILYCSVYTYNECTHTVQWLFEGNNKDMETTTGACSARVIFPTPHLKQKFYESLKCSVTDNRSGKTLQFGPGSRSSREKTGITSVEVDTKEVTEDWLRIIIVLMGLAALITAVVVVNIWMKTKGNKQQLNDEDADEGTVTYENVGEPSASIRLH